MVIGEPQRNFYGNQFGLTFPLFEHFGVQLWVPDVGGPIDPGSDAHTSLYGGMSKGERNRAKIRVRSAMAAQAAIEGRYLGGRPPYGYLLADHHHPAKAADGRRLHALAPDSATAPIVRHIFADYLASMGIKRISPSDSVADGPARPGSAMHLALPEMIVVLVRGPHRVATTPGGGTLADRRRQAER